MRDVLLPGNETQSPIRDAVAVMQDLYGTETISSSDTTRGPLLILRPKGLDVLDVEKLIESHAARPNRLKGSTALGTIDSFISETNLFGAHGDVRVFATYEPATMTAVFNYHSPAVVPNESDAQGVAEPQRAGWLDHRATYNFPLSPEWIGWLAQDGEAMSQTEFAEFIEDHVADVEQISLEDLGDPSSPMRKLVKDLGGTLATTAELVALSRGLDLNVESRIASHTKLASGEGQLVFEERHTGSGGDTISVPNLFMVTIPVFEGAGPWRMLARLRYRVVAGKLTWSYQLHKPDRSLRKAIEEEVAKVATQTGFEVVFGTPPSSR